MKTWLAVLGLLVVSILLHLWRLDTPREVVFDEVHFGKFVTAYCCTHERFFDIHPPHAKLLIAGTARLLGYRGDFDFDHISEEYGDVSPLALRAFPALTGIALPLVFFACLRLLGISVPISFLGGLMLVFDNALLVQTRMIALDGFLLLATFGALAVYLLAEKRKSWWLTILAGVMAGLALGTKFTGLAALVLLGAVHISKIKVKNSKLWLLRGLVILASAFVVYIAGWWLHFALLTQPGSGDVWGVPAGHFWQDTVKLHQQMLSANYRLTATHPDESKWWGWPLMLTSVFYWSGKNGEIMYFLGNPAVWWGTTILFLIAFSDAIRKKVQSLWIPFVGFLIALLPLTRVPRALFLYHYLTPLLFALMFGLVWFDTINNKKTIAMIAMAVVVVCFIIFSPITYGFHVSPVWLQALWWLPGWR